MSAERIEAGSITVDKINPTVGSELIITSNPTIATMSATITIVDDEITAEMQRAQEAEEELSNRITVNSEGLAAEITRATGEEEELANSISVTAEGLSAEITRATNAEDELSNSISVTSEGLSAEITRATSAEGQLSNSITTTAQGLSAEITRATEAEGQLSAAIDATAESISIEVQKGLNGQGGYSSIYQTASQVSTIVSNNAYVKRSGITIETDGIHMFSSSSSQTSSVDITPSAINVKSGSSINISGGTFTVSGNNFSIDSSGNVTVKGNIQASSGSLGGWTIDNNYLASGTGSSKVWLSGNSSATAYAIIAGADTPTDAPFTLKRDGTLKATNATITGSVTASSGSIGGWTIGQNSLYAGTGTSHVELSTASGDYAIWAGAASVAEAPFRVKKDGTVYSSKFIIVDETGKESVVDLRNYALWKLGYSTIKSWSVSGSQVSIVTTGGTINFNSAASVTLEGEWSGNRYTVTASNGEAISTVVTADISSFGYNSANHQYYPTIVVYSEGGIVHTYPYPFGLGTQAYSDGQASATLTASGWSNGTNKVTNDYNSSKFVNITVPSIESYGDIILGATDIGTAVSKTCTATLGGTTRSHALTINASSVYSAGITAGEGHFSLASLTLQGTEYTTTGTYYTAGTKTTYYTGNQADYYLPTTTLYKAGTKATYYKGDGGSGYLRGTSVSVNVASNIRRVETSDVGKQAAFYWTSTTYYQGNGGYIEGRGNSVEVTPIGDEGTKQTVNTRGNSVEVTPIGTAVTRYSANPSSLPLYRAGSEVTNTYYIKNS